MKAYFVWTVTGPKLYLTSSDFINEPDCLKKLADIGVTKFVAQEVSLDLAKQKYGTKFDSVLRNPKETDELRAMDTSSLNVLNTFSLKDLGQPIYYEPEKIA